MKIKKDEKIENDLTINNINTIYSFKYRADNIKCDYQDGEYIAKMVQIYNPGKCKNYSRVQGTKVRLKQII